MSKKLPTFEDLGLNELDARDRSLYLMWESSQYRSERVNFRLWIVILVLIVALIGTNVGWLIYESQWETVEATTITQSLDSGEGGNAVINDGVHINGESETDSIDN